MVKYVVLLVFGVVLLVGAGAAIFGGDDEMTDAKFLSMCTAGKNHFVAMSSQHLSDEERQGLRGALTQVDAWAELTPGNFKGRGEHNGVRWECEFADGAERGSWFFE